MLLQNAEALAQKCSAKKVFLKISQNSQETNCARAPFLTKMQAEACIFTYWHLRFPGNFENYLSAAFLIEYLRWLLLRISSWKLPLICLRKDNWKINIIVLFFASLFRGSHQAMFCCWPKTLLKFIRKDLHYMASSLNIKLG